MGTKDDDDCFSYEPPEYGCDLRGCGDPGDWDPVTPKQKAAEAGAHDGFILRAYVALTK